LTLATRKELYGLAAKLAALEILFGGPLLVSDELRPILGKWPAVVLAGVLPIVLFYMGASNLAEPEDFPPRRTHLWLGVVGALMVAPMNLYAIQRLLTSGPRVGAISVFGVVLCTVVIITYLVLAIRALRKYEPGDPGTGPRDYRPID
jgi:hypothetical protein